MINIDMICFGCMRRLEHPWTVCPYCGHDNTIRENDAGYLPAMLLQGQYFVGRALGRGGFGITYLGLDLSLERVVAIKEYFPSSLSTRMPDSRTLHAYNANLDEYQHGCDKALEEGRIGARVGRLPNVVQIYNVFQANNTAYIVMEYIQGKTLAGYMKKHGGKLPWAELQRLMFPVIASLGKLHEMKIIHRDVSPDNIMIREPENEAVLLDFGAAHTVSDKTMSEHSISLRLGYAPLEQYSRLGKQDGRIDEYAMCATMYYALTGQRPPDATERMYAGTEMTRPRQLGADIPAYAENALMKGLSLRADERYDGMNELLLALQGKGHTSRSSKKQKKKNSAAVIVAASVAVLGAAAGGVVLLSNANPPNPAPVTEGQSTAASVDVTSIPTDVPTDAPTHTPASAVTDDGRVEAFGFQALTNRNGTCTIIGYNGTETVAGVPEIMEDYYVTTIASLHQSGLKELAIGSNISEIQEGAFSGNAGMVAWVDEDSEYFYHQDDMIIRKEDMTVVYAREREKLVIPEGVKDIEIGALPDPYMENGAQLESISLTLPASMNYCTPHVLTQSNVGSITVAEGNPNLRVVDGVLIYRDRVLACPPRLTQDKVTIPSRVTEIEDTAFSRAQVQHVVLPNTVTTIGDYAFEFSKVERVTIPASVTEIGDDAFLECENLTLMVESGSYAEQYAINNRIPYETEFSETPVGVIFNTRNRQDGTCILTEVQHEGPITQLDIPSVIDGYTVTDIECRFDALQGLRRISLPSGVKNIQYDAFGYCDQLETIEVDESAPYFRIVDNMLIRQEDMALVWTSAKDRTLLQIPEGVQRIDVFGLPSSSNLYAQPMEVVFPSTLTNVPVPTFYNTNVSRVWLAEGNTSFWVGDNFLLMKDTTAIACPPLLELDTVIVPDGTTYIDNYCFANAKVKHVVIPASVTSIGVDVFQDYEGMIVVQEGSWAHSYVMERGLNYSIGANAPAAIDASDWDSDVSHFQYTETDGGVAITGYTGDNSCVEFPAELGSKPVTAIAGNAFMNNETITHVLIPEGVKRVEDHAFAYARALEEVFLPDSLESIGIQAFTNCKLRGVYIGANVKDIHMLAFEGCDQLNSIDISPKNTAFTLVDNVLVRKEDMAMIFMPGSEVNGSVTIPEGVRVMKGEVHRVGQSVSRLNLPSTLEQVDGLAMLMLCNGVPPIAFPNGSEHIYWNDAALMCKNSTLAYYDMSRFDGNPVIPEGTERIASGAFMLAEFDELVIPASVTHIEAGAFRHSGAKRIIVPASVTTIEEFAFEDCPNLTLVVEAGSAAEAYARAWKIPCEVTSGSRGEIKTGTGKGFGGDVTVRLTTDDGGRINWIEAEGPNETKGVGSIVFEQEGFMGAFIGKTAPITEDDVDVVSGATLTSKGVIAAANDALTAPETDFEFTSDGQGATIIKYVGSDSEVVIPASLGGMPVTAIGDEAFAGNQNLKKVYIPDGVITLGDRAFNEDFDLMEVRLPTTLERIDAWAFGGCSSLMELTLPAGVTYIADQAFPDQINTIHVDENNRHFAIMDGALVCTDSMRLLWTPAMFGGTLTVPEGVRELGDWSVRRAETVVLPSTLETVEDGAFVVCDDVKRVVVAEGNRHFCVENGLLMRDSAVVWCPVKIEGETITLPAAASEVAPYAFFSVEGKNINVPGSVKKIGWQAFSYCRNGSIILAEGVETLDGLAFSGINNMTVTLPESINNIPDINPFEDAGENVVFRVVEGSYVQRYMEEQGIAYEIAAAENEADFEVEVNGSGVTIVRYLGDDSEVVIPASLGGMPVTAIGEKAFEKNETVTKVTIPDGVMALGRHAFSECSNLVEIRLPETLETIGEWALGNCRQLKSVRIPASVRTMEELVFANSAIESIQVVENSPYFTIMDGGLVEKTTMTLLWTPDTGDKIQTVPEGVKHLANWTVHGVDTVVLPATLESVSEDAFLTGWNVKNVVVAEGNPYFSVKNGMLMKGSVIIWCPDQLESNPIILPTEADEVGYGAFGEIQGRDFVVPGHVKKIGPYAFNFTSDGSIVLEEGVEQLEYNALANLRNMTVSLPVSLNRIDNGAIENQQENVVFRVVEGSYAQRYLEENDITYQLAWPALDEQGILYELVKDKSGQVVNGDFIAVAESGGAVLTAYMGPGGTVEIPAAVEGMPVTAVAGGVFAGRTDVRRISIPAGVEAIAADAFRDCEDLLLIVSKGSAADRFACQQGLDKVYRRESRV